MSQITPVFKREFLGYFRSLIGYVFLVIFLALSVAITFFFNGFYKNNEASLASYFVLLPWMFLILAPAAGMGLWAEEKRSGTIELLQTLPITVLDAVIAKFLASWAFLSIAIALSFPLLFTVRYLGDPDMGIVAASYLGAVLMGGSYLAVCSLTSAFSKSQIIAFVVSFFILFIDAFLGSSVFDSFLTGVLHFPGWLSDLVSNFSLTTHFEPFTKGIIDPKDVVFFLSLAGFSLFLNVLVLER